jgi:hypothetical protein
MVGSRPSIRRMNGFSAKTCTKSRASESLGFAVARKSTKFAQARACSSAG